MVVNCIISDNSGSGVANRSAIVTIINSSISGNFVGNSAAICGGVCGGMVEIGNTILTANAAGNIDGSVTSHGYNISSDDAGGHLNGPGDQINTDPLLGPLQDNGGPTLTHLPMPASPRLTQAIRTLLGHLITTSAARVLPCVWSSH